MGTSYRPAGEDVHAVIERMMKKYHAELWGDPDKGPEPVKVDALLAFSDDGPAVMLRGRSCYAVVRIVNLRDRCKGMGDAEITIDAESWKDMDHAQRDALIDHELQHLQRARSSKGGLQFDDLGRPKLKMRLHDVEFGWFLCVAERHQDASIERQQATELFAKHKQLLFGFADASSSSPRAPLTVTLTSFGVEPRPAAN